jgi:hypothetical protein
MIKVTIDEASAFDMLSILEIKLIGEWRMEHAKKKRLNENYELLKSEIIEQIGEDKYNEILDSEEYRFLLASNNVVFQMIDKVKESKAREAQTAKVVQSMNDDRFRCKGNLQNTFFNNKLIEQKI